MDALVIGAGPVGLLCAHLLHAPCVGEVPGGDAELRRLAPSYLWESPALEPVLRDLGLSTETEEVRFAFWGPRGVTPDVTPGERAEYLRRSGRDPDTAPASAVSSGAPGRLTCYRASPEALCAALLPRVSPERGKVSSVLPDLLEGRVRVLAGGRQYNPALLVNSIPAPAFDALLLGGFRGSGGDSPRWPAGRKWFATGSAWADALREARDGGLRWVYVTDPRIPFDRVGIGADGEFAYEFNQEPPDWFPESVFGRWEIRGAPLQVTGSPRPEWDLGGLVRHVGRMARWDHRIRLHNVAEALT